MPSISEILAQQSGSIPEPPKLPMGKYQWSVKAMPNVVDATDTSNGYVDFPLTCMQPIEGVDMGVYAKANQSGQRGMNHRIYVGDDGGYDLDQFLVKGLGLNGSASLSEKLSQAIGRQFLAVLGKDKKGYNKLSKVEPTH